VCVCVAVGKLFVCLQRFDILKAVRYTCSGSFVDHLIYLSCVQELGTAAMLYLERTFFGATSIDMTYVRY
jgi:hypothetical protein